jgi:hypothetical protein
MGQVCTGSRRPVARGNGYAGRAWVDGQGRVLACNSQGANRLQSLMRPQVVAAVGMRRLRQCVGPQGAPAAGRNGAGDVTIGANELAYFVAPTLQLPSN